MIQHNKNGAIPNNCQLQCDVCGMVALVENRGRICLFDMPNHSTGWAKKNDTTLVRPTAATVQDKIKRISLKCSQRLQK